MATNLFAYNISGTSVHELSFYNSSDLDGNKPFVVSASTILDGYFNISSIKNWDLFGGAAGLRHCKIRHEIKDIYDANTGLTWSAYTIDEQKILSKYFLVEKSLRDEVLTDEEQEEYNHYKIYNFLSDDVYESIGNVNPKLTPKSIDYKKDLNVRLNPEYKFDKFGFLTGCTYYENLSISYDAYGFTVFTYDNPILEYTANYTFADNGYTSTRSVTRRWYKMDGILSEDSKESFKVYPPMVARDEARIRRKNLINELIIKTVGLFIMTSQDLNNVSEAEADALPLLKDINPALSAYYEFGTKLDAQGNPCQLIQEIAVHPYARLDNYVPGTNNTVTIRMFILNGLNPQ